MILVFSVIYKLLYEFKKKKKTKLLYKNKIMLSSGMTKAKEIDKDRNAES